mmetsp:Transcript_19385/g.36604  ORF Transcript_19385/g.36604 Transcript_19385/m.36604 type:complete len:982 (-) Transcript_19385:77-3022(-)|eukprot:scaffold162_cov176-Amphora_coffeaeformis.AAC.32
MLHLLRRLLLFVFLCGCTRNSSALSGSPEESRSGGILLRRRLGDVAGQEGERKLRTNGKSKSNKDNNRKSASTDGASSKEKGSKASEAKSMGKGSKSSKASSKGKGSESSSKGKGSAALPSISTEQEEKTSLTPSTSPSDTPTASFAPSGTPSAIPSFSLAPSGSPSDSPTASLAPTGMPSHPPSSSLMPSGIPSSTPMTGEVFGKAWLESSLTDQLLDVDKDSNYSAGDLVVFEGNSIFRQEFPSGTSWGRCRGLSSENGDKSYCVVTYSFPEGNLYAQGVLDSMAFTGGTGLYASFTGKMSGRLTASFDHFEYTFKIDSADSSSICSSELFMSVWTDKAENEEPDFEEMVQGETTPSSKPGDAILLLDGQFSQLSNIEGGSGFRSGECTIIEEGKSFCSMAIDFTEGSVTVQGVVDSTVPASARTESLVIVGGNGCFSNASGSLQSVSILDNDAMAYRIDSSVDLTLCKTPRFGAPWVEKTLNDRFVDNDQSGTVSSGDMFVISSRIQTSEFAPDGTATGVCTLVGDDSSSSYCTINFEFREGIISTQGYYDELFIIGGTGCFKDASGVIVGYSGENDYEYSVTETNLYEAGGFSANSVDQETCSDNHSDLLGTWIELVDDILVDRDQSGTYSNGDVVLLQGNAVQNQANLFITGQTMGTCTALPRTDLSYCLMTIELNGGRMAVSGEFGEMLIAAGSKCYADVDAKFKGFFVGDNVKYEVGLQQPQDPFSCGVESMFTNPWFEMNGPLYTSESRKAGNQIFVDSTIGVDLETGGGPYGTVLGVCTFVNSDETTPPFCNMEFGFEKGTITVAGPLDSMVITATTGCFLGLSGVVNGFQDVTGIMLYQVRIDIGSDTDIPDIVCPTFDTPLFEDDPGEVYDTTEDGFGPGDMSLLDGHQVLVPGFSNAIASGFCTALKDSVVAYCSIAFKFEGGSIVVQGPFESMMVVGGSGCFGGLEGTFHGSKIDGGFEYTAELLPTV